MAPAANAYNWFTEKYDRAQQQIEIGECDCGNTAFARTSELPDKMIIGCVHKLHKWGDISVAEQLSVLGAKGRKPAMYAVKNNLEAWLRIVGNNLTAGAASTSGNDIEGTVQDIPHVDNDVSRAMEKVRSGSEEPSISPPPEPKDEIEEDEIETITRGIHEIGTLPDADFEPKPLAVRGSAGVELALVPYEANGTGNARPESFWLIRNPNAQYFVEVNAAGLAYLGEMALRHGLPLGTSLASLYRAWKTGDPLLFARALEPLALKYWPEKMFKQNAASERFGNTLKQVIAVDGALQHLENLKIFLPETVKSGTVTIPPPNPRSIEARETLDRAVKRRRDLDSKGSRGKDKC